MIRRYALAISICLLSAAGLNHGLAVSRPVGLQEPRLQTGRGSTTTALPDGRILVLGGEGTETAAWTYDPRTGATEPTANQLLEGRAGHTATVLPDGTVLIVGGRSASGETLSAPEVFDSASRTFRPLLGTTLTPRASHTATLLTDGRVLLVGGVGDTDVVPAELWNPATEAVQAAAVSQGRSRHTAVLNADGRVLIAGGLDANGKTPAPELYDAVEDRSVTADPEPVTGQHAYLAETTPSHGAKGVSVDVRLAARFSTPIALESIVAENVRLLSSDALVTADIVPTEGGRLLFIKPRALLEYGTTYRLEILRLSDTSGQQVLGRVTTFTTDTEPSSERRPTDDGEWTPNPDGSDGWQTGNAQSPWESIPLLQAPLGTTALAGRVLSAEGVPLTGVTLRVQGASSGVDAAGRFLLAPIPSGRAVLVVDAHAAGRRDARGYGMYEIQVEGVEGRTTALPFTIWLSRIDRERATRLDGRVAQRVATPRMPGVEVNIPGGAELHSAHIGRLDTLTMTPLPADRAPVPLPPGVQPLALFTLQTHDARVEGSPQETGVRIVYPNTQGLPRGTRIDFWAYDANAKGWSVYGHGTVDADGRRIEPDRNVRLRRVQCLQFAGLSLAPDGPPPDSPSDGDPVDLVTGLFVYRKLDMFLPDVMSIALARTYRPNDLTSRAFGIGTSHSYDLFLVGPADDSWADLILPDGASIHYVRTSPPGSHLTAVMEHTTSPTRFYKSILRWNNNVSRQSWDLALRDGTVYEFGTTGQGVRLVGIRDRVGNQLTIQRNGIAIVSITSPHGRVLEFTTDTSNRVTKIRDPLGREVSYSYDTSGRLAQVTDPANGVTEYTYDTAHRMLTIRDGRGIVFLTNEYDTSGRVARQTQADQTTYEFAYTVNGTGQIIQTDVTNPRGLVRRVTFNADEYWLTNTNALGTSVAQLTTVERQAGSQLVTALTDALNRRTEYSYDAKGNVLTVTELAGTSGAITTTFTYEPKHSQVTSVTDPLSHSTTYGYDGKGNLTSLTTPLQHQSTFSYNSAGQVLVATNPANESTQFGYEAGDLISMTDSLGRRSTQFFDAAGRLLSNTDPLGRVTRYEYNPLNLPIKIIDARGGQTSLTYDPNGNLLTLTDARNNTTTYSYDSMDRAVTRTDPLQRQEAYLYDNNGNLRQVSDRKSQVTTYTYDPLDRPGTATHADNSTISHTFDAGDRLTQVSDSIAGTISRSYDLLDRMTSEVTPEGSVAYSFDAARRRQTMTVAGQPVVTYSYDNANRLTGITQGTSTVALAYDSADRRTSLTLPNGVVVEYAYDVASQITALTYRLGATTLGTLTYAYDQVGSRTQVSGTWARTGLPAPMTSATYDAANQIATWAGTQFTYDLNGNLTSDGVRSYTWSARNQLSSLTSVVNGSFAYDAFGRRRAKTIGSTTNQFLFDGANPVQELSGGTPVANLLTGLGIDEYFTRTDAAGPRNFLADALGSSVALADASGTVQTSYTYTPFGAATTSGAGNSNAHTFTGREDDGTGLYFYRARYYDSQRQRFLSEDPLGFEAGDPNLYAYVGNAPTMLVDPTGEFAWGPVIIGCLIGAGSSGAADWIAGRKIDWPAAGAGCLMGALGGLGGGAGRGAAAAAGRGAGGRGAGAAARGAGRGARGRGPNLPDEAWNTKAPRQVTPGVRQVEHYRYNPATGQLERSTVYYDQYGRQIGRTDWTTHGRPNVHPNPHHHSTEYGPGYGPKGYESGPQPGPYRPR